MLLNYACPSPLLDPLVPAGTELDAWNGQTVISLVGFMFARTRVGGIPIPFHVTFEEVNLRFYVRRITSSGELRRAVVFVRELVPRAAIASLARWVYNEPYTAVPMSHAGTLDESRGGSVNYSWRFRNTAFALSADVSGPPAPLVPGSEAEFVTEHYWGYTRQRDGGTLEYEVEHPPWKVWHHADGRFTGPAAMLYGDAFGAVLSQTPQSAFVAMGSAVAVHRGVRLPESTE